MRRPLRRTLAAIAATLAATLAAIPSRIVVEVAVVAAFVAILLAIATPGDHRNPDASAPHSAVQRLKTGGTAQPPACAPDARGQPQRPMAAPPVEAQGTRCRDLQSYV
jgi:hypothetical protein